MHLKQLTRRRMLAGLTALAGMVGGNEVQAQAQPMTNATQNQQSPPDVKVDAATGAILVPLGGFGKFSPNRGLITGVTLSGNEQGLKAVPAADAPNSLVLTGQFGGSTQMSLTFADGGKAVYTVIVQPDYEQLKFVIRQAVPTSSVEIIPGVGNVIILSGSVSEPQDSDNIVRIASSAVGGNAQNVINALRIGGSQHVMIDVTVAQVDRTELRERGFNFNVGGGTVNITSILGGVAALVPGEIGAPPLFSPASANIIAGIVPAQFTGALRALKTEGLAKFLSEPKIVTQTGRPAFFRAGGQQAVLSPASGINGPGVQLLPVGTELEVLPIVYGNGDIYLEVNPRVSSVNNGRGIATTFGFTPGFNEQQTRSSIMLKSGQTFAIGGLLETTVQASSEKVPYLGDLPFIGTAFSSVRHEERETELLILVTPRLVEPMDHNQVPGRVPGKETRSADDYELFLEQLLEAPRGTRQPWTGRTYNPAYQNAPGAAPIKAYSPMYEPNGRPLGMPTVYEPMPTVMPGLLPGQLPDSR